MHERMKELGKAWGDMTEHVLALASTTKSTEAHVRRMSSTFRLLSVLGFLTLLVVGAIVIMAVRSNNEAARRHRQGESAMWRLLDQHVDRLTAENHDCMLAVERLSSNVKELRSELGPKQRRSKRRR